MKTFNIPLTEVQIRIIAGLLVEDAKAEAAAEDPDGQTYRAKFLNQSIWATRMIEELEKQKTLATLNES